MKTENELIANIKYSLEDVNSDLEWLNKYPDGSLNDYAELIKYLLKENLNLKNRVEKLEKHE